MTDINNKFIKEENIVEIRKDINLEKIFDQGVIEYFTSKEWIEKTKSINSQLEAITQDSDQNWKYLV